MKLNLQLLGSRGASSSRANISTSKASFQVAKVGGQMIDVKGVTFEYKDIPIGVYDKSKVKGLEVGRGEPHYVAVMNTTGSTRGAQVTTGKTQKEAIQNAREWIDRRLNDLKARNLVEKRKNNGFKRSK